jgi:hypothetical protein
MDKAAILLFQEMYTLANTQTESHTEKENTLGRTEHIILAILNAEKSKEKANGKVAKVIKIVIRMTVIIITNSNTGKVYIHGQVEIFIKEIISKMKDMEMGKCFGRMGVFMRENG